MTIKIKRSTRIATYKGLVNGLQANASNPSLKTLTVSGTPYSNAALVKKLQQMVTIAAAVPTAKAPYQSAVDADRAQVADNQQLLDDLVEMILRMFGGQNEVLETFSLAPKRQRTKPSPATLVQAAAKNKATREARGTKGPKAKLAITGVVPTSPETPPAPAPASESAPAPAPATGTTPKQS
jgi:hypothetical protein